MKLQSISKEKLILLLCQGCLLAAAVLFWLFNRGNAFQKSCSLDEFRVTDSTVVIQDVTTDETMSEGGIFLETPTLSLDKGVYLVEISYNADREGSMISVGSKELSETQLRCKDAVLNPRLHHVTMTMELTEPADDVVISAGFSGEGYISITEVGVFETSAVYKRVLIYSVFLCLILMVVYLFVRGDKETKGVILALSAVFGISLMPLLNEYVLYGHDMYYHMLRIEGIREGLSMGIFPVKIHPVWAQDYGYAVGVFYGDIALYFPAVLRLFGFSVQAAYKIFIGVMNLGTILIAYFSFKRMFCSRLIGVLGSMCCCLNYYRMLDVYRRAAIGECLGIMMFPLVLLSFYLIFMETDGKNWWKHALLTAFSLTGLVQSHILSCEMVFFLVIAVCVILVKKVFTKEIFKTLATAAILSVFLNIGFLVPFLDFYNDEILIGSSDWVGCTAVNGLQATALDTTQIFSLMGNIADTVNGEYMGMGTFFGLGGGLYIVVLLLGRSKKWHLNKKFYPSILCFGLGCCMVFMSSKLFPWDVLAASGSIVGKLCYSLEFPWRLLAPGTVLLIFSICYVISELQKNSNKYVFIIIMATLVAFLMLDCGQFLYDRAKNGMERYIYATEDLDTMLLSTNDYLPTVTNADEIEEGWLNMSNISKVEAYTKRGTEIQCQVTVGEQEGVIDFPLNYYRYYSCTDNLGQELPVSSGHNGMLRVSFPADYTGNIQVAFCEPWHWRLAEIVSLLTGCGCVMILFISNRKEYIENESLSAKKKVS